MGGGLRFFQDGVEVPPESACARASAAEAGFYVRTGYTAGQGSKADQSVFRRSSRSGGKASRNVNAWAVGPCCSRRRRRFFASSIDGRWPTGTHHSAAYT